jgi:O-antigen ligase
MDPLVLLLKVTGGVSGFALFVYVLYRIVLAAKKTGRTGSGGQIVGIALMVFGAVLAPVPPPPQEVATESREQKRNEDDGDPL